MKWLNKYSIVAYMCIIAIVAIVVVDLTREYSYKAEKDYIYVELSDFYEYKPVKYFDQIYTDVLEIPTPEKKGMILELDPITSEQFIEFDLKETGMYEIRLYHEDEFVGHRIVKGGKYVFGFDDFVNGDISLQEDKPLKVFIKVVSGSGYGVSYIGLLEDKENSVVMQEVPEEGIIRNQIKDIGYIDEEIRNQAISQPENAYGAVCYYEKTNNDLLHVAIANIHDRPITIHTFMNEKGERLTLEEEIILEAREILTYDSVVIKTIAEINPFDLYMSYSIQGSDKNSLTKVVPFSRFDHTLFNGTMVNKPSNVEEFHELHIEDGKIMIKEETLTVDKVLFIPEGYVFLVKPGQTIDFTNAAYIYCQSQILFDGTESKPIKLLTSDYSGQGIFVNSAQGESYMDYVEVYNMDTPTSGAFKLTGSVTFYESDVTISNCLFKDNVCEDSLNIVRSKFLVENSLFEGAPSDCFDGDFCEGTVRNSVFADILGDAIDFSTSKIRVENCTMVNIGDKGISGGEHSTITFENVDVKNAQIAVASKDSSTVTGSVITIEETKIGYMLYQKKPEFGGGYIQVSDSEFEEDGGIEYLVQEGSLLYIDGVEIVDIQRKNQEEIIEKVIAGEPIE